MTCTYATTTAGGVEPGRRLVEDQQFGTRHERAAQHDPRAFAFRKRTHGLAFQIGYGRTILTEVDLEVPRGGKWVLFGPNGIGNNLNRIEAAGYTVIGVSGDDVRPLQEFREKEHLNFVLLAVAIDDEGGTDRRVFALAVLLRLLNGAGTSTRRP